jgi:ribonuclease Z
MVEIVFLGTGGAFPTTRRSNTALMIEAPDFSMLVEAGPTVVEQLLRVGLHPPEIQHLFVSHSHGDHTLGFPVLILNRLQAPSRINIYGAQDTISTLKMLWTLAYADFDSNYLKSDWHRLSDRGLDEMELAPGVTLHTAVVPYPPGALTLAARWDFEDGPSIAFATDTIPNAATIQLARDCDLLVHESSYSAVLQPDADASVHFHSTARQAGEVARQAGCRQLALVHLGADVGDHPDVLIEEARADTDLDVIVPEDGDRLRVSASES